MGGCGWVGGRGIEVSKVKRVLDKDEGWGGQAVMGFMWGWGWGILGSRIGIMDGIGSSH